MVNFRLFLFAAMITLPLAPPALAETLTAQAGVSIAIQQVHPDGEARKTACAYDYSGCYLKLPVKPTSGISLMDVNIRAMKGRTCFEFMVGNTQLETDAGPEYCLAGNLAVPAFGTVTIYLPSGAENDKGALLSVIRVHEHAVLHLQVTVSANDVEKR